MAEGTFGPLREQALKPLRGVSFHSCVAHHFPESHKEKSLKGNRENSLCA
jgi:hypothetical protein